MANCCSGGYGYRVREPRHSPHDTGAGFLTAPLDWYCHPEGYAAREVRTSFENLECLTQTNALPHPTVQTAAAAEYHLYVAQ